MILRDLSTTNMGRGAYDTTGVPKPQPPPKPRWPANLASKDAMYGANGITYHLREYPVRVYSRRHTYKYLMEKIHLYRIVSSSTKPHLSSNNPPIPKIKKIRKYFRLLRSSCTVPVHGQEHTIDIQPNILFSLIITGDRSVPPPLWRFDTSRYRRFPLFANLLAFCTAYPFPQFFDVPVGIIHISTSISLSPQKRDTEFFSLLFSLITF